MSALAVAAAAYAVFLVGAALGLDRLGRHAHHRSGRFRTNGFTYQESLDAWLCPEGEHLRASGIDHHRRVARYRARAHVCNACPVKDSCTDSDEGREVVRPLDPWPHSEAGRFHRGLAVTLLGLAAIVAAVGLALDPRLPGMAAPGAALLLSLAVGLRMAQALAATPSGFPAPGIERDPPLAQSPISQPGASYLPASRPSVRAPSNKPKSRRAMS
jgi:hypothetical protein